MKPVSVVALTIAIAVGSIVCKDMVVPSHAVSQTPSFERCPPSLTKSDQNLRVVLTRDRIEFSGTVATADEVALRHELAKVLDPSGSLRGRPVCLLLRTDRRKAGFVTATIPDVVRALDQISGDAVFRAMWGGGGLTVVGWMKRDDKETIQSVASGSFPVDTRAVGLTEDLPALVRLRVEGVNLSTNRVLQIEQFHPKAGLITLSTTSNAPLRACPGGWRGATPTAIWSSRGCVTVHPGRTAAVPDSGNDHTHLSLAIRPVRGSAGIIDVDLRYTAVDQAFECYLGGVHNDCTLLPPHLAK